MENPSNLTSASIEDLLLAYWMLSKQWNRQAYYRIQFHRGLNILNAIITHEQTSDEFKAQATLLKAEIIESSEEPKNSRSSA